MTENIREKLEREVGPADWKVIRPHFLRGAVIVVSPDLDLIDVAKSVAEDDAVSVEAWINSGRLTRPAPEDAKEWEESGRELNAIVLDPFVLLQEIRPEMIN